MSKILDQNLLNNMLKGEREYFYRSNAFYYSDSLATKVSKIVFPIFIVCYLALAVRDAIDIALSKRHFKKIPLTEFVKNKSNQFLSKYGTTIIAAGALGYLAYRYLSNSTPIEIPKTPEVKKPTPSPVVTTSTQTLKQSSSDETISNPLIITAANTTSKAIPLFQTLETIPQFNDTAENPINLSANNFVNSFIDNFTCKATANTTNITYSTNSPTTLEDLTRALTVVKTPPASIKALVNAPSITASKETDWKVYPAIASYLLASYLLLSGSKLSKRIIKALSLPFSNGTKLPHNSIQLVSNRNLSEPVNEISNQNNSEDHQESGFDPSWLALDNSISRSSSSPQAIAVAPDLSVKLQALYDPFRLSLPGSVAPDLSVELQALYDPFRLSLPGSVAPYNLITKIDFDSDAVMVKKPYDWGDKHRLAIQQLWHQAKQLGLIKILETLEVENSGRPFIGYLKKCLRALDCKNTDNDKAYADHKDFIIFLRKALSFPLEELSHDELEIMKKLEELAYFRFTDVSFSNYLESLLYYSTTFNDEARVNLRDIADQLKGLNKEIHKNTGTSLYVEWEKLKGATNINFDPQSEHNLPYARSWFSILTKGHRSKYKEKLVWQIRASTPTNGDLVGRSTVNQEFEGFLKSARRKGQKVCYANLQAPDGADGDRSNAIKALQDKYKDTFFVWSLPFDGKIFQLEEKVKTDGTQGTLTQYAKMTDEAYKELLITEFFREPQNSNDIPAEATFKFPEKELVEIVLQDSEPDELKKPPRFSIPKNIKNKEQLKENLTKLLDDVHNLYFEGADLSNNVSKRRSMVLLFYAHLIDFAAVELDIDFIITACKDNKDRGGAMNAICEMVRMIRTNKHTSPEMLKKGLMHVLGAGLHTKFEHILENRLVFFDDVLRTLVELKEKQIKTVQEHIFGYTEEQIFGHNDENKPQHRFFNHRKIGKIVDFNYTEDVVTTDIPFADASNDDELSGQLKKLIQVPYEGTFDQIEFSKIFGTYRKNGQISPEKVYKQFDIDFDRAFGINKGSVALKQPNGTFKYYLTRNKEELLESLNLPKTWDNLKEQYYQGLLKEPEKWNCEGYIDLLDLPEYWRDKSLTELIKHFEFFSLITQPSSGAATQLFFTHPLISNYRFNDKISFAISDTSDSPNFGFEVELVPSENIYKMIAKNSFCFRNEFNSSDVLAKIFIETEFDLANRKINYRWWVDSNESCFELPERFDPPSEPELEPVLVAFPAQPMRPAPKLHHRRRVKSSKPKP